MVAIHFSWIQLNTQSSSVWAPINKLDVMLHVFNSIVNTAICEFGVYACVYENNCTSSSQPSSFSVITPLQLTIIKYKELYLYIYI